MPFDPTSTKLPVLTVPVEPAVLPRFDTPANTPPSPAPPPDGTLITTEPLLIPTEAIPAPAKIRELILAVPVDDCVEFEVAYIDRRGASNATDPPVLVQLMPLASVNASVWNALDPPAAVNAWLL